jgi:hypothetical protein
MSLQMPYHTLIELVPKENRKKARKLLKEVIRLELMEFSEHISSNVQILTNNVDYYREFSVRHDSEIDWWLK